MGQITSGIGLVSGINTADIIDQLLAIEARPKEIVQRQNAEITTQQAAFQSISARLLGLELSIGSLTTSTTFGATSSSSSNESVLTASSSSGAVPGSYSFTVDRLVTTQQVITGGFIDQNITPIAPSGGSLTFEFGDARLSSNIEMSQLNGGTGISRGKISVTDRDGKVAVVDLSKALALNDVLDTINNTTGIDVTASVDNDGFVLTDTSGGGGTLSVADIDNSGTAASLGLNTTAVGNTLTGSAVNILGVDLSLNTLRDGNGIRIRSGVDDLQVTRRDNTTFNVNLDGAVDLGDVIDKINTASGGDVTASITSDGTGLQLVDTTGSTATNLQVTGINGSLAATDLEIVQSVASNTLTGDRLLAKLGSRMLSNLNGGSGITTLGSIDITNRSGSTLVGLDLSTATSVSDVVTLINNAGHNVVASMNDVGNGILLSDTTGSSASNLIVSDNLGTTAADLGLAQSVAANTIDSENLQLRYISEATSLAALNGGLGVASGRFVITDSTGASGTVDLTQGNEVTVQDVINEINSRGLAINAQINANGDGILIQDTGTGVVALTVEESGSTTARDLGLLGEAAIPGADLDGSFEKVVSIASIQTLTGTTALSTLNAGDGVSSQSGVNDFSFIVQDGSTYNLNLDGVSTINDLISTITATTSGAVTAAINTAGTGLTLTDNTSGASIFQVSSLNNSLAASDLGILTTDDDDNSVISGETIIDTTTLQDLTAKINDAGMKVNATIINDGSTIKPFRLSFQSSVAGKSGQFLFDDGGLNFGGSTLVEAQNAVAFFGSPDPAKAIAVTSSNNTLTSIIPEATIDLKSTSDSPVTVTVTRDDGSIADAVDQFVDNFNGLASVLEDLDFFNVDTQERGVLLGDPTVASIRSGIFNLINSRNTAVTSQFKTLGQIGITVRSGANLSFDRSKFLGALENDFNAVQQLFTFKETETDPDTNVVTTTAGGTLVLLEDRIKRMTDSTSGLIQNRVDALDNQIDLGNQRIEQIDEQLEAKRGRLEAEFLAMELALARLQSQNTALANFQTNLAATTNNQN